MVNGSDADALDRRRRMGAAIRRLRGDRSQGELAELLGVSQAGVSLWESGGVDFSYEQILGIEVALGVMAGTLARIVGYVVGTPTVTPFVVPVETVDDVVEAIRAASRLGLHVVAANRVDNVGGGVDQEWLVVVGDDESNAVVS